MLMENRMSWFVALIFGCLFSLQLCPFAIAADYLEPDQAFRPTVAVAAENVVRVGFTIAPGYHLYRTRTVIEPIDATQNVSPIAMPEGTWIFDQNFNQNVEVWTGQVNIDVPIQAIQDRVKLRLTYQGCADAGLCYSPQTGYVDVQFHNDRLVNVVWSDDEAGSPAAGLAAGSDQEGSRIEEALRSGNWITIASVFFVAGVLLSLTPCVLPMVPILSSIIVGQRERVSRLGGLGLALAYTLGMAFIYTIFGIIAGVLGEGLAAAFQNPWVLGFFAVLLTTFALSMFDVFDFQMPNAVQERLVNFSGRFSGGSHLSVFVMGGLSALIVGPCVAAPLAGALVFISQTKNLVIGGLSLFSLAMGMGVPLLLVGVSAGSVLPRTGVWMERVKYFFGFMLLGLALWIVSPVLPSFVLMSLFGAILVIIAVAVGLLKGVDGSATASALLLRGCKLVLAILGVLEIVGGLSGGDNLMQPLAHFSGGVKSIARTSSESQSFRPVRSVEELDTILRSVKQPILLDFYADWCFSCKEMAALTLSDPVVVNRLSGTIKLQADVTLNNDAQKALLRRFGLFGPPGILFFDATGQEIPSARVIGFAPTTKFLESLTKAGI